jgi:hypothetical protein|tara:strand:+ start:1205 stop:1660 length:456 start_codon:yes stop_codon:yes gene_type:complete
MAKYQQGDVLFISRENEQESSVKNTGQFNPLTKREHKMMIVNGLNRPRRKLEENDYVNSVANGSLTVAHGEVTGHSHRFDMSSHLPGIEITSFGKISTSVGDTPEFVDIVGGPATITHEEHDALTIPQGTYQIKIVREFDHLAGTVNWVVD